MAIDAGRGFPVFPAALVLAFAGGATALAHQLLWTRRLIDLLGASHEAAARVFGVFFLGLALGSMVAAVMLGRAGAGGSGHVGGASGSPGGVGEVGAGGIGYVGLLRNPWRFLAGMELGIGLLALPIALLPWWTGWLWPALGPDALVGAAGGWVKLVVSLVCLLPPSFCMGFFVPVVVRELARDKGRDARGSTLALYAANTLGGVVGLAVAAGFAIHAFGLLGAMLAATGGNVAVAAGCWWIGRRQSLTGEGTPERHVDFPSPGINRHVCRGIAFFSGMAVLAAEVLLVTLLGLVVPVSFYGPAAMLALVILALAVAAGLVALPWVRRWNPARLLVGALVASAGLLVVSPWAFHALVAEVPALIKAGSALGFVAKLTVLVTLSFGLAMVGAGLIFPLVAVLAERTRSGCGAREWGWLLAWNGVGALLGAELTYRLLLPAAGLHAAIGWVACAYAAVAFALALRLRSRAGAAVAAVVLGCVCIVMPRLDRLPVVNPHVGFDVHEVLAGREGVVAVVEHPAMGRGILLSNQYMLGSTSARWSQERQAHLPLLLHPDPKRVAFLGVATGNTPAAALSHVAVESVDAVEISPLVVEAARRHFADLNAPLFADPRARVVVEDGRIWFAACRGRYDVIAGDLFQPWGPGEGRLFSLEHFTAIRGALADGGVFCQWLPGHQLTRDEFETILATFCAVFGEAEVFVDGFFPMAPSIALVGWKGGGLDWAAVRVRCDRERREGGVLDPVIRHAEGIELLHLGSFHRDGSAAGVNTLDNNRVELAAGLRQIRGAGSLDTLRGGAWRSWMREAGSPYSLASRLHEAEGRALQMRVPLSQSVEGRTLWLDFPAAIRGDPGADWKRWPGTLRPME